MDNIRLKFLSGQQSKFLNEVSDKSRLSTRALAIIAKIHPHSFRDWKREKLTMTLTAAQKFVKLFNINLPEDEKILTQRWQKARRNANKIGGLAMFEKYGSPGIEEGRRKGGIKAIANLRKNGIIPKVKIYKLPNAFTEELAEYIGILLGDGCITPGKCNITLNSAADREYIPFVSQLGKKIVWRRTKII